MLHNAEARLSMVSKGHLEKLDDCHKAGLHQTVVVLFSVIIIAVSLSSLESRHHHNLHHDTIPHHHRLASIVLVYEAGANRLWT